jgi:hypothetical protein
VDEDRLKTELIGNLQQMENQQWETVTLIIQAPPFTSKEYKALPGFKDKAGKTLRIDLSADAALDETLYAFIYERNQGENRINEITLRATRDNYADSTLTAIYNPQIEADFQASLPRSKRGKTVAWYHQGR